MRAGSAAGAALIIGMMLAGPVQAAPPSAVLSAPEQAVTGSPASFDASASTDPDGDALAFAWSIDGQDVAVEHDWLSVSFAHPGTHTVVVTVTDPGGSVTTAKQTVVVTGPDRAVGSLSPIGSLVPGARAVPDLKLTPPRVRIRHRKLRVVLRCRGGKVCSGTLRAVAVLGSAGQRPLHLAQRRFTIHSGGPRVVHVRLSRAALRRLHRHSRIRVTAYRGRVRVSSIWATYGYRVALARR